MFPVLLGVVGVVASVASLWSPAERRPATLSTLLGVAGVATTALLAVVLPPISFYPGVLWGLVSVGALVGVLAGSAVGVGRDGGAVVTRGGAWHLLPAAVALLALQGASVAESTDGVVFATAAVVGCSAFAVGAIALVAVRATIAHRHHAPAATRKWLPPAAAGVAGAAAVGVGIGLLIGRGGGSPVEVEPVPNEATAPPTSEAEPTPGGATESPAAEVPGGAPTSPTPTAQEAGQNYIGMTYPSGEPPSGITDFGGGLIAGTGYATVWMSGPEGDMFWLLRQAGVDPDGSVTVWRVADVVVWPPVTEDSAQVVSGAVRCEVEGEPAEDVVAVFPLSDAEWFEDPYAAWRADATAGEFVPAPANTRCVDEGYGV